MHARASLALLVVSSALALTACDGGSASGKLPCDVEAVLKSNCQSCHAATPKFGAPMPLVTYADLTADAKSDASKKVYELVGERIHDDAHPMPQAPNPRLDAADTAALDEWIADGAPAASEDCGSGGAGGFGPTPISCTPDLALEPATSFTMPTNTDDIYICYGFDVSSDQKRQVTAFVPRVVNPKIVHHIVLFESDAPVPAEPTPCSLSGAQNSRIVSVWAPGGEAFELPKEAGIPLEGTTHYMVQVHYNNLTHLVGETDNSGFDLCTTTDLRPNDADILAFGTFNFEIPAHGSLDVTCNFTIPAGFPPTHVIGVMPHMHKLGTAIATVIQPAGGGPARDLGGRVPWDFNSQYWSKYDEVVQGGDSVKTQCAWSNNTDQAVTWGEDTEDEMCFSFTAYYPKITVAQWQWALPSYISQCLPTQ